MRASLVLEKGICCNMKVLADLRAIQTGLDGMSVKEKMFPSYSHSILMSWLPESLPSGTIIGQIKAHTLQILIHIKAMVFFGVFLLQSCWAAAELWLYFREKKDTGKKKQDLKAFAAQIQDVLRETRMATTVRSKDFPHSPNLTCLGESHLQQTLHRFYSAHRSTSY